MLSSDIPDAYLTIALGIFPSSWNITDRQEMKKQEKRNERREIKNQRKGAR